MNRPIALRVVIGSLIVTLLAAIASLVYMRWQNSMWKMQIDGLARFAGSTSAKDAFRAGEYRLFIFDGVREKDVYSGTNEGPFEIWYSQYFPEGQRYSSFRYTKEQMVAAFNSTMRDLHARSDKGTNGP